MSYLPFTIRKFYGELCPEDKCQSEMSLLEKCFSANLCCSKQAEGEKKEKTSFCDFLTGNIPPQRRRNSSENDAVDNNVDVDDDDDDDDDVTAAKVGLHLMQPALGDTVA